jgi:predicted Rossmann-fold nucleotide-binding protein
MIVSDAFIVVPGGIGSLLEMSLAWQLLQVQKLQNTPLILIGKMWGSLIDWGRQWMLREDFELASEVDFEIPICAETIDEAIEVIRKNRIAWLASQNANQDKAPNE